MVQTIRERHRERQWRRGSGGGKVPERGGNAEDPAMPIFRLGGPHVRQFETDKLRGDAFEYRSPRGELTVTAPIGFGRMHLQPAVHSFLHAYPDVSLRLVLSDRVVSLVDEHVDVAVRLATLPDSELVARPAGSVRRSTAAQRARSSWSARSSSTPSAGLHWPR